MSGSGVHVHGPHRHELELELASHRSPSTMAGPLAVTTAIVATVGALFSSMVGFCGLTGIGVLPGELAQLHL